MKARMLFALLALCCAAGSGAETIRLPLGAQGSAAVAERLPSRGMSSKTVLAGWGEPEARQPAVGDPPIARWDYTEFSVFFENDLVLHSVVLHRPLHPSS